MKLDYSPATSSLAIGEISLALGKEIKKLRVSLFDGAEVVVIVLLLLLLNVLNL